MITALPIGQRAPLSCCTTKSIHTRDCNNDTQLLHRHERLGDDVPTLRRQMSQLAQKARRLAPQPPVRSHRQRQELVAHAVVDDVREGAALGQRVFFGGIASILGCTQLTALGWATTASSTTICPSGVMIKLSRRLVPEAPAEGNLQVARAGRS